MKWSSCMANLICFHVVRTLYRLVNFPSSFVCNNFFSFYFVINTTIMQYSVYCPEWKCGGSLLNDFNLHLTFYPLSKAIWDIVCVLTTHQSEDRAVSACARACVCVCVLREQGKYKRNIMPSCSYFIIPSSHRLVIPVLQFSKNKLMQCA